MKMIEIRGKQVSEDTVFGEKGKPKTVWITAEEVEREGKKSLLAAVEMSIKKYWQVYEATDEELIARGDNIIRSASYCGLCQKFTGDCTGCVLESNSANICCREWRELVDAWGNWPVFRPAVLKMIERLEMERDKLLKPKPYVFQAGDVAENSALKEIRIICNDGKGGIMSINTYGGIESHSQKSFENCSYKKIGVLSDFIKHRWMPVSEWPKEADLDVLIELNTGCVAAEFLPDLERFHATKTIIYGPDKHIEFYGFVLKRSLILRWKPIILPDQAGR